MKHCGSLRLPCVHVTSLQLNRCCDPHSTQSLRQWSVVASAVSSTKNSARGIAFGTLASLNARITLRARSREVNCKTKSFINGDPSEHSQAIHTLCVAMRRQCRVLAALQDLNLFTVLIEAARFMTKHAISVKASMLNLASRVLCAFAEEETRELNTLLRKQFATFCNCFLIRREMPRRLQHSFFAPGAL